MQAQGQKWVGVLLVALSAAAFGAMPIFTRLAYARGADLVGVLVPRFWIAGIVLAVVLAARRIALPPARHVMALAALGGIGFVGQSYAYFTALRHAEASLVALLLYLYPFFVMLMAAAFLGERITGRKLAALAVCLAGTALAVGGGRGEALGIVLGVTSAVLYSIYIVISARVTRGVDPVATAMVICLSSAVVYTALALLRASQGSPPQFAADATGWWLVLAIALVSTVLSILCFFAGMARLGATQASTLSTLEPVVTVALAALFLGESLSAAQMAGGVLILAAVLWLARRA
jgi:drug/metabolite transporter (DMT)-like permease